MRPFHAITAAARCCRLPVVVQKRRSCAGGGRASSSASRRSSTTASTTCSSASSVRSAFTGPRRPRRPHPPPPPPPPPTSRRRSPAGCRGCCTAAAARTRRGRARTFSFCDRRRRGYVASCRRAAVAGPWGASDVLPLPQESQKNPFQRKKCSPYSITERRRVLEPIPVLGSQPASDVSHEPGSRLPLLSARPAVAPPQPLRGLLPVLLLGEQRLSGCEQFA